jgi:hypothetical protein
MSPFDTRHTASRLSRRRFLGGTVATALATATAPRLPGATDEAPAKRKTILSFYLDDTGPYVAGARAFQTFLDYCADQGLAGESSLILGANGRSMVRQPTREEADYLAQVRRAWASGIGTHMELMTHRGLFDFAANREPEPAVHEGVWLHDPAVTVADYERYIGSILAEGERADLRFTGLTLPGCSCAACTRQYGELKADGHDKPNPNLWTALLNLAKQGKFRGPTVPCFFNANETNFGAERKVSSGKFAVFDLVPNTMDQLGKWTNSRDLVNPDYYITADGKSGMVVKHVQAGSPYCLFYAHWQGLNPSQGVGWKAFTEIIARIRTHLKKQVVWMRPSDITDHYQEAGGWGFLDKLNS